MAARTSRCVAQLRAPARILPTFTASAGRPARAVPPFYAHARTAFSWSGLTDRLTRWTRPNPSMKDNALVEKPREAPPSPPPAASSVPVPAKEEPQSIFDKVRKPAQDVDTRWGKEQHNYHDHQTHRFKISHRKLNKLARQIGGKPIDYAILQMTFSEKRAARKVKDLLVEARDDAQRVKGLQRSKLVVAEAWVTKALTIKRLDIKGRGKTGIKEHRYSKMNVRLREGKTPEEREEERRKKALKRINGPGFTREDVPLRNVRPMWTW